jgi:D-erythrulose 1-phosphate 3-epimerase
METESPKIHLAIDNCFASKRWTRPQEWIELIADLGLKYIEASADTECDPLYMGTDYLRDWVEEVKRQSIKSGLRIVNLYSGHGTYATLGLSHTDARIRDRFQHQWVEALIKAAEKLKAGMGFFCHAFNDSLLQNKDEYAAMKSELYDRFADLSIFADRHSATKIGVEQMYVPHQIPWTIDGTAELLKKVYSRSRKPFYVTLDTGHQTGQHKFKRPTDNEIRSVFRNYASSSDFSGSRGIWLGPKSCHAMIEEWNRDLNSLDCHVDKVMEEMDAFSFLFASDEDGDPCTWIEKLGCYSPIIHLQQTDKSKSSHDPFTPEYNATGVITGEKVLKSLAASYQTEPDSSMPPRCTDIYFTLEIFFETSSFNRDIISDLEKSVAYWRRFIPEDGIPLDQLA